MSNKIQKNNLFSWSLLCLSQSFSLHKSEKESTRMSFLQHLEELRWRLVRSVAVILVMAIVIWCYQDWIMRNIFISMSKKDFVTFEFCCKYLNFMCVEEIPVDFQSTTVSGQFSYGLMM